MDFKNIIIKNTLLFFLVCFCSFSSFSQEKTPLLKEIVTDNAGIFTSSEKEQLKNKLTNYETKTSTQIVVLTITSLNGRSIEGYALDVFKKNELGQKNIDNGILLLFSKQDRKVRIEVGYGLESVITDLLASRIIRNIMIPNFKKENYFKGINEGTSKIIELLDDPQLIDEFLKSNKKQKKEITVFGKIFGNLILTPIFFLLFLFGYNKILYKENKINIKNIYKNEPKKFYTILVLIIVIVNLFMIYFFKFLLGLFVFCFLSIFIIIGIGLLLKEAYNRLTTTLTGLLTGELGVFIFPFYLPTTFMFLLAGFLFTLSPLFFGYFFIKDTFTSFNISINIEPKNVFFILISILALFLISTLGVSIYKIVKDSKKSFGFSLFNHKIKLKSRFNTGNSSGRSYSSRGSSSSSYSRSSLSSSSFSGGGGSSGGGGASGSW